MPTRRRPAYRYPTPEYRPGGRPRAVPHPFAGVDPVTNTPLLPRARTTPPPLHDDPAGRDTNRRRRTRIREALASWWPDAPKSVLVAIDREARTTGSSIDAVIARMRRQAGGQP